MEYEYTTAVLIVYEGYKYHKTNYKYIVRVIK